ncbi:MULTISPECIES: hypothetical protein [unclassified Fusibacter]|uniref:hypothetical protein n=1 Tax=unclassified Fusibacter TaxID=2624464 RepID=UPI0010109BAA|nr:MULTISPECIES: hypothetical protein [unclassified Fusibacter]MCK8061140.1 hypothetical protein [Fusibacter sp. A2]NPE23324.1 hypothetical protein [Fusibacter sp. A1]RXV59366.1 hypothetical protein DWB64_16005 [Fusibacter sp. A1]
MQKTLGDMARYLKQLLPVNVPDTYKISTMYASISEEENIRNGVLAFRDFIDRLCDCLIEDESLCDILRKGKEKFSDETTLTVEFPFLNNIRSILINIGHHAILSENGDSLMVVGWDILSLKKSLNKNSTAKISGPQMIQCLRFLTECGICFIGIDLSAKKPDVSKVEAIEIMYPDHPIMLTGWKVLGYAQNELATRKNDDILLRCDYRVLKNGDAAISPVVKEFVHPLPDALENLVLQLHQHYLDSGMECNVELGFFCTHIIYSFKRKAIWRFSGSFHNGYRIILKTKHTEKYTDIIDGFPDFLREKIAKNYGCDRKTGTEHGNCQKGCEGFSFPLDESLLSISKELKIWQDSELSCM